MVVGHGVNSMKKIEYKEFSAWRGLVNFVNDSNSKREEPLDIVHIEAEPSRIVLIFQY